MKAVLIATDLSARSDRALARAAGLARSHGARLTVLHVVDENLPSSVLDPVIAAAEAEIGSQLAGLGRRCGDATVLRVVPGNDYRAILDAADRSGCELIVLGRHRNESCEVGIEGTTLGRVVRMAGVPVLSVAERAEHAYARVMVGVDFSDYSRRAVRAAIETAPAAELHLVHAFDVPFEGFLSGGGTRRQVRDEHERGLARLVEEAVAAFRETSGGCRAARPEIHEVLRQGEALAVLREEAARIGPDLIAIGTHGRSGLAAALLGSVARDLLERPPCDVLVAGPRAGSPRG